MVATEKQSFWCGWKQAQQDIHGMHVAAGILTARGGMTSHAAVVARGMGRACVCGAGDVRFDEVSGKIIQDQVLAEGDLITIDGATGDVYGAVDTIQPKCRVHLAR